MTEWATFLPQVYNADSIGYRPDLIKKPITEWKELINPEYKGKAAILDVPAIGIMDAALCFESAGEIKYGNKGNMTKSEIDFTINRLIELKKQRSLPRHLDDVRPIGAAHGRRRGHRSVDVVAGRGRGAREGYALHLRAGESEGRQGRLSRLVQRHGADEASVRQEARCCVRVSELVSRPAGRAGSSRATATTARCRRLRRNILTANEWDYWYEGKPAKETILDPYGVPMEKAGAKRDGGSFLERVTNISCWNTLMDEAQYMNKRWNDFKAA